MRKICVVTGSRAEYGILYWVLKGIDNDPDLQLQVCVTGMHLSPEFGLTYKQIEEDGFFINEKIEIVLSSDTPVGISKSMGLALIGFAEALDRLKPDLILLLGDRYEIFSCAAGALVSKIPVVHCHGGEITKGAIDESLRHAITKMSHIHFCSTDEYRERVIQLGEDPSHVFNVGALGIENIKKIRLLSRDSFQSSIGFEIGEQNFLVTFHPVTLDNFSAEYQFKELLKALDFFPLAKIIFTKPNSDTDGRIIISLIDQYVEKNKGRSISFISMGQLRYLSALKLVDLIIGNSSSGLIEVPSFKKPTVNIGDRQEGRIAARSVINCGISSEEIVKSIELALSKDFQSSLKNLVNPYDNGNSSEEIIRIIKNIPLIPLLKKKFFDLIN